MGNILLYVVLLLHWSLVSSASEAPVLLGATVGEDCDLPCLGPQGQVLVLEWTIINKHLLFYRDGRIITKAQDQRFRNRVKLKAEMKDGVFTVTLKNVSLEDSGTYTCKVLVQTSDRRQSFTRTVQLRVSERTEDAPVPSAQKDQSGAQVQMESQTERKTDVVSNAAAGGNLGPILGGVFSGSALIIALTVLLWNRKKIKGLLQQLKKSDDSPPTTPVTTSPSDSSALIPPTSQQNPQV